MKNFIKNKWVYVITIFIGALGGLAYWKLVGCATGSCPINSNPYLMTGYGVLLGTVLGDVIEGWVKTKK